MLIHRLFWGGFLIFVLVGGWGWWRSSCSADRWQTADIPWVHVLFAHRSEDKALTHAFLMSYYFPEKALHLYQVNPDIKVFYGSQLKKLFADGEPSDVKHFLEDMLGLQIDGIITLEGNNVLRLLRQLGATGFFNLRSTSMSKGEVVLSHHNYTEYMRGVADPLHHRDVLLSVWISFLYNHLNFLKRFHQDASTVKPLKQHVRLFAYEGITAHNLMGWMQHIIASLDALYFEKNNMNVEVVHLHDHTHVLPLNNGQYDAKKLHQIFRSFEDGKPSVTPFPITVQVKNATPHKRLAARTSGVLRLKRCTVKEYLNAEFPLERSVLLDRSGSVLKRHTMQQATKVSRVYFCFDYIDNFDFTLYLGEDYYAIPLLKSK